VLAGNKAAPAAAAQPVRLICSLPLDGAIFAKCKNWILRRLYCFTIGSTTIQFRRCSRFAGGLR
jgi:hypothetical protein